jgi:hypothetical protein
MADDEETNVDDVGGNEEEEEESTFSKVGGMFGGGGGDGDKDEEEEEAADAKAKAKAAKKPKSGTAKSLFDIAALKEFGLSVLTLFIETIIISVICVNILFFSAPESIRNNRLNLNKLFPTERAAWPYCYTNEHHARRIVMMNSAESLMTQRTQQAKRYS